MKKIEIIAVALIAGLVVAGGAWGGAQDLGLSLEEDFESMTATDPITDYPGWIAGGAGYASGTILAGNFLQISGTYPGGSGGSWDWVKLDLTDPCVPYTPPAGMVLTYSVDAGNNLVAGQFWGRRVRWGIVDGDGSYLTRVEMLDFNNRLTFNGVHYDGLLASSRANYVFELDFNDQTVTLTRNDTVIGTESMEGTPRSTEDIQGLIFEAGANYPNLNRWVRLDIDNILLSEDYECPAGDIDGDCFVDLADFSILAANWLAVGREPNDVAEPNTP